MSNRSETLSTYLIESNRPDLYLVEIAHPAGTERFHNGLGRFDYEGEAWYGCGGLGGFTIEGDGAEVAETAVTFTLSGVDPDTASMIDTSAKPGTATITQVFLRPDWTVDQSVLIEDCRLEKMDLIVSDGSARIELKAKGGFREINQRSAAVWDPQNQRQKLIAEGIDPDSDTGFDQMHIMRDKLIVSIAE
jgi:hypothetical protein